MVVLDGKKRCQRDQCDGSVRHSCHVDTVQSVHFDRSGNGGAGLCRINGRAQLFCDLAKNRSRLDVYLYQGLLA